MFKFFRKWKASRFKKKIKKKIYNSRPTKTTVEDSPSGKYTLVITHHSTGPHSWNCTKGVVSNQFGEVAIIERNYGIFPFSWVEGHPNGHDYLVCGADYQGQTIIELDTHKRKDFLSPGTERGWGFCWASHVPSPDKTVLAVEGCVWGGPYELVFFEFSKPLSFPKEVASAPELNAVVKRWVDDQNVEIEVEEEVRKSDGKFFHDLSDEEIGKAYDTDDYDDVDVVKIIPFRRKDDV